MNVSDTLNKAADLIEKRGWTTGGGWTDLTTYTGPLCAQGAIGAAMGVRTAIGWRCPAMYALMDYIGITQGLFTWNDTPGRTATEVVEVLRATALVEASHERETAAATR